jgi:AcrR family transcriptional regulator
VGSSPPAIPAPAAAPSTSDRILDAALTCVARVGSAKTALDDIAREAGCSRATLYRHFPGKHQLLAAAVAREADRACAALVAQAAAAPTLADAAATVVCEGVRTLVRHRALQFVVAVEPEAILPHISFDHGDAFLAEAATRLAPAFAPYLPPERAARLAEWLVRLGISYLCSPESAEMLDPARVRSLVDDFVLPGFTRPAVTQGVLA